MTCHIHFCLLQMWFQDSIQVDAIIDVCGNLFKVVINKSNSILIHSSSLVALFLFSQRSCFSIYKVQVLYSEGLCCFHKSSITRFYRVCHMNLDKRCEVIIFESNLTTFKLIVIFWGTWGRAVVKIGSSLKPNHLKEI